MKNLIIIQWHPGRSGVNLPKLIFSGKSYRDWTYVKGTSSDSIMTLLNNKKKHIRVGDIVIFDLETGLPYKDLYWLKDVK